MDWHYILFLIPISLLAIVMHNIRKVKVNEPLDRQPFEEDGSYAEDDVE